MVAGGRGAWSANFMCQGSVTTPLLAVRHGLLGKVGPVRMMGAAPKPTSMSIICTAGSSRFPCNRYLWQYQAIFSWLLVRRALIFSWSHLSSVCSLPFAGVSPYVKFLHFHPFLDVLQVKSVIPSLCFPTNFYGRSKPCKSRFWRWSYLWEVHLIFHPVAWSTVKDSLFLRILWSLHPPGDIQQSCMTASWKILWGEQGTLRQWVEVGWVYWRQPGKYLDEFSDVRYGCLIYSNTSVALLPSLQLLIPCCPVASSLLSSLMTSLQTLLFLPPCPCFSANAIHCPIKFNKIQCSLIQVCFLRFFRSTCPNSIYFD